MVNEELRQAQGTTMWTKRRQPQAVRDLKVNQTTSATGSVPGT